MKVIYAGFPKTGTKTIEAVFREFGYNTYDFLENSYYHGKDWRRIIKEGGTVEDFRRMYEGVDALVDGPCFMFWEEILEAFPDAKIIFSVRDEESWLPSFKKQIRSLATNHMYVLMQILSYSGWRHFQFSNACALVQLGSTINWPWCEYPYSPTVWKRIYRNHNNYVLHNAPKDKLLVFDFKDGWGPICEFLGEKVPDKPFPHRNIGASIVKESMDSHPIIEKMMREVKFTLGVLTLIGAYGGYKVYQNPSSIRGWINTAMTRFKFW
ncbi:uncharacterized protein LOC100177270 isoform X1 [Ciona intestinalis]